MSRRTEMDKKLRQYRREGWTTTLTASGSWKLTRPDVPVPTFIPATALKRNIANAEARLRRVSRPKHSPAEPAAAPVPVPPRFPATDRQRLLRAWAGTIRRLRVTGRDWAHLGEMKRRMRDSQKLCWTLIATFEAQPPEKTAKHAALLRKLVVPPAPVARPSEPVRPPAEAPRAAPISYEAEQPHIDAAILTAWAALADERYRLAGRD